MHAALSRIMETWPIQRVVHRDTAVDVDGNGFCAVERLLLLGPASSGVREGRRHASHFGKALELAVAVRGLRSRRRPPTASNSIVRRAHADVFPAVDRVAHEQVRLVRDDAALRMPERSRFRQNGPWHVRRASLSLRARIAARFIVECDAGRLAARGVRQHGRRGVAHLLRTRVRRPDLGGASADFQSIPLAELSAALVRGLEGRQRGSDRRCAFAPVTFRLGQERVSRSTMRSRSIARWRRPVTTFRGYWRTFEAERRPVVEKIVAAANSSSFLVRAHGRQDGARSRRPCLRLHDAQRPDER